MNTCASLPLREWPLSWAFLLSFCIFMQGLLMAIHIPLGEPPDELAHASYLRDAIESSAGLPDYSTGKIINSGRLNYLGHPPLYYSMLAAVGKAAKLDPTRDYRIFRLIGVAFVTLGFLFFVLSARNIGVELFPIVVMTVACCATPMYAYLAGSINNDTLMYLGVSLFIYGVTRSRMLPGKIDLVSASTLVLGLVIAALTKATAAAFLVFFIAAFALLRPRTLVSLLRDRTLVTCVLIVAATCCAYYAYTLAVFGTPFPKPSSLYELNHPVRPVGMLTYTLKYASSMWDRLPAIVSHVSISPYTDVTEWFFYVMFASPVAGWFIARVHVRSRGVDEQVVRITDAFMIALVATVIVHVLYVRASYLNTGLFAGWQPRYYLFALPFLWVPFYAIRPETGSRAATSLVFVICTVAALWTSSPLVLAEHARGSDGRARAAAQARNSVVKRSPDGDEATLSIKVATNDGSTGHIDSLSIESGTLQATGWAVDSGSGHPARRIWVLVNGRYLGSTQPRLRRPDVAEALSNPSAITSGFRISIRGIPSGVAECDVRIASEGSDGNLAMLRDSTCED